MEFQPFSVPCVTCGSRLRVNRADLVGNIVNCPKCQSMVQLSQEDGTPVESLPPADGPGKESQTANAPLGGQPVSNAPNDATGNNPTEKLASLSTQPGTSKLPQPPIAMGHDSVDSGALTEDSIAQLDLPDPSANESTSASAFTKPPPRHGDDVSNSSTEAQSDSDAQGQNAPLPPDWQNRRNAKTRKIALSVAVALASIASAVFLYSALQRRARTADGSAQDSSEISANANETSKTPGSDHGSLADAAGSDTTPDANSEGNPAGAPTNDEPKTLAAEPDVLNESASPGSANENADQNPASDGTEMQPDKGPIIPLEMLPQNPLLPVSPLDSASSAGPTSPFDLNTKDASTDDPDAPDMSALPEDIRALLGPIDDLTRPHAAPTLQAPPSLDEVQLDRAATENIELETVVKPRKPINMRQALGMRFWLAGRDQQGYPLNDFAMLISQWSRVPIQVEWVAFDIVGTPIDQPVALPSNWLSVEQILNRVCESVQAEMIQETDMIRIQPDEASTAEALKRLLDLSDLPSASPQAVQTVRTLLRIEGGDTSIVPVSENAGEAQLAALVCESIRRCRGEQPKLSDAIAARWTGLLSEQVDAWPEVSDGQSIDQLLHPIPFAAVLRRTANLNGATCFVNWADAAKRRLGPSDEQMPHTGKNVSASAALQQMLKPESLQVHAADSKHWWVGSAASFDRLPVVIWFDETEDANETMQKVASIINDAFGTAEHYANVTVDPTSGRCIALLPRFIVRQLPRVMK